MQRYVEVILFLMVPWRWRPEGRVRGYLLSWPFFFHFLRAWFELTLTARQARTDCEVLTYLLCLILAWCKLEEMFSFISSILSIFYLLLCLVLCLTHHEWITTGCLLIYLIHTKLPWWKTGVVVLVIYLFHSFSVTMNENWSLIFYFYCVFGLILSYNELTSNQLFKPHSVVTFLFKDVSFDCCHPVWVLSLWVQVLFLKVNWNLIKCTDPYAAVQLKHQDAALLFEVPFWNPGEVVELSRFSFIYSLFLTLLCVLLGVCWW